MAAFPPLTIPVTSTLQVPITSTLSEEHNETLPPTQIHAVAIQTGADHLGARRGDFVALVERAPIVGSRRKDPQKTYHAVMAGEAYPAEGVATIFPLAEACPIKKGAKTFVSAAVGGVREVAQNPTNPIVVVPGDRVYASIAVVNGKIEFALSKYGGDYLMGTVVTSSPLTIVVAMS